MANNRTTQQDDVPNESLIANGDRGWSPNVLARARYGDKITHDGKSYPVVGGSWELPNLNKAPFNVGVSLNNGYMTLAMPQFREGARPSDHLFNRILSDNGNAIASDVGNAMLVRRGDVVSGYSVSNGASSSIGVNGQVFSASGTYQEGRSSNYTPGMSRQLMQETQTMFDVKYLEKVVQWCEQNKNGAAMIVGGQAVCYTEAMVRVIKSKAEQTIENLDPTGQLRAEMQGQNLAQTASSTNKPVLDTPSQTATGTVVASAAPQDKDGKDSNKNFDTSALGASQTFAMHRTQEGGANFGAFDGRTPFGGAANGGNAFEDPRNPFHAYYQKTVDLLAKQNESAPLNLQGGATIKDVAAQMIKDGVEQNRGFDPQKSNELQLTSSNNGKLFLVQGHGDAAASMGINPAGVEKNSAVNNAEFVSQRGAQQMQPPAQTLDNVEQTRVSARAM